MRLDHLLSKERWPPVVVVQALVCPRVWDTGCSRVEHRLVGTGFVPAHQYGPSFVGGVDRGLGAGVVLDTLLGPEGSGVVA